MKNYKNYIDDLKKQKSDLVTALQVKGVEATNDETFNTLVPKVENITTSKPEQEKTVFITSSGSTIVTPDSGKVLSKVTASVKDGIVNNNISVSNSGLITVNTQITSGYVATNAKQTTKQLSTQAAKTVTPNTSNQTAVTSGKYTTGAITVKGDSNLKAENIKKDVSIFGVTGSLESGSSGYGISETWVFDNSINLENLYTDGSLNVSFESNGQTFSKMELVYDSTYNLFYLKYDETIVGEGGLINIIKFNPPKGKDYSAYRKITLLNLPEHITDESGDSDNVIVTRLYELLLYHDDGEVSNATKQSDNLAIQTGKSITVTSNGTTTITPDVPYDGLSKVDLTVNVGAGDSGHKVKLYFSGAGTGISAYRSIFLDDDTECVAYKYITEMSSSTFLDEYAVFTVRNKIRIQQFDNQETNKINWHTLPSVTSTTSGNATLISGKTGTYMPLVYEISGDCTFSNLGSLACITAGTLITMFNGSKKPIENIIYDDELLVWDFYNGCFASAKPCWIKIKQTATEYNRVTFSNGSVIGFVGEGGENGYHRIFNIEKGSFTHTGTINTPNGTHTFCEDGNKPYIIKQEIIHKNVDFYNIITEKYFNIFANGILTSCKCSNIFDIKDMKYIGEQKMSNNEIKEYFNRIQPLTIKQNILIIK